MNKNTRNRLGMTFVVALAFSGTMMLASCGTSASSTSSTETTGMPPLQPVLHSGRWELGATDLCYSCHGASSAGNPTVDKAQAIPESHYQDGSSATMQLDSGYSQCINCHPVAQE